MLTLLDYATIAAYFVAIVGVGLRAGRHERTMEGFALGDRRIPWWAVVASILAAEVSAATFLGAPVEGYAKRNFTYAEFGLGMVLARIIVGWIFIKPYFDYRVVSIYELLAIRFGVRTKNAASAVFLVTRALASGARLYAAAILLVVAYVMATGHRPTSREELLIYIVVLTTISVLTAVYTVLGGIKAVVWTDAIQTTVMYGGLGAAVVALLRGVPGGWAGARSMLESPRDLAFFETGITPGAGVMANVRSILQTDYTIWSALLGVTFMTMATHGTDQDMVQRMLTAKDHRQSRRALVLSGLVDIPIMLGFLFVGVLLWAYYRANPDPNLPAKESEIFAYFILHELPSGVRGLLVAGVFATAMGSLSTALNALATSFTKDWYLPYLRPDAGEAELIRATRWATAGFSALLVAIGALTAWAAIAFKSRIIPVVLGVFGYTYGSLLGIFLLGALTKTRGSDRGNVGAMAAGFVAVVAVGELPRRLASWTGSAALAAFPRLGFPWFVLVGTVVTTAVAACFRTPAKAGAAPTT
jgi:SSS family transporter